MTGVVNYRSWGYWRQRDDERLGTLPQRWIQESLVVRDRDGRPQDPLTVHCFCVCSGSALSDLSRPPRGVITPPPPVFMRHPPNHLKFKGGYQGGVYGGCLCDRDGRGQILT